MWYQVLIPGPVLLIPILVMTTKGIHQVPKNDINANSDVIVTYSKHAEATDRRDKILVTETSIDTIHTRTTTTDTKPISSTDKNERSVKESSEVEEQPLQDDVVFVPNEQQEVVRNEDYLQRDRMSLQDLMSGQKTLGDILAPKEVRMETESPNTDIIFVTGKNNDANEKTETHPKENKKWSYDEPRYKNMDTSPAPKLNCSSLYCNNTIKSVCGGKLENNQWRYRLFLNDCFFRKVNCNFRSAINRFIEVPIESCKNIGHHSNQKAFSLKPTLKFYTKPTQVNNTRRTISSRRSMTVSVDGQFCSHPCPVSCPEHYEPECAVSATGRHRVFVNHCTLDHNSCSFGVVWHKRPLAECVGGKKADMRQNAGFIGWMQRVGIVDRRGRLQLS